MTLKQLESGGEAGVSGHAIIKVWRARELNRWNEQWPDISKPARHALLKQDQTPSPHQQIRAENLVTDNYLAGLAAGQAPQPTHLAIGDGTTAPATTNDSLNNEVYRTVVGQDESSGKDRITSTFISQNEANGLAIREIGLTDGSSSGAWQLLTHLVLDSVDQVDEKTSNMTLTIDYVLEYRNL